MFKKVNRRNTPDAAIYFVYALTDPRDGKRFYIGKGKGNRPKGHMDEWRYGYGTNRAKIAKIDDIVTNGYEIVITYIAKDLVESEAYRVEHAELVAAREAGEALTNQQNGLLGVKQVHCDVKEAFDLVQSALREVPNKAGLVDEIRAIHGRDPSQDERRAWLKELGELVAVKKAIVELHVRKYGLVPY